jgi:hypothetical protein
MCGVVVCCSDIIVSVEIVLRLTCFFAENNVNGVASMLCDDMCVTFVQNVCCKLTQPG